MRETFERPAGMVKAGARDAAVVRCVVRGLSRSGRDFARGSVAGGMMPRSAVNTPLDPSHGRFGRTELEEGSEG